MEGDYHLLCAMSDLRRDLKNGQTATILAGGSCGLVLELHCAVMLMYALTSVLRPC